ncbi:MAG: sigma-70 family RNA polymerase sigma factor [Pseudomonadota bacterium]
MLDATDIESLYQRLERPLFNVAFRWTWNDAQAQELVQEAFLRLWNARWRVRPDSAEAYVYRIVLNLGQKHAGRRSRWRDFVTRAPQAEEDARGPEQDADGEALRRAIVALPDTLRSVLLLCEYSGLRQREIAALLDIRPGTVGSRRHEAMARLREALDATTVEEETDAANPA